MAASTAQVVAAICSLMVAGCMADRYQWNLAHETVTATPKLSQHEIEKITRVVTRATLSPIFSIVRVENIHGHEQVSVAAATSTGPVDDFMLEKVGTEWHITSHEQSLDR
jgi:hypothetical protein